jgi:hypothetical protein
MGALPGLARYITFDRTAPQQNGRLVCILFWSAFYFSADNRMTAASFRRASPNHAQGFAQL